VRYSVEFNRAEVELVRMVDSQIPQIPIFVHPDTRIDRCDLDNLLLLKAPSVFETLRKLQGLDTDTLHKALAVEADALERYASDFLWLDLSIFEEFDLLIKSRVAQNPQRLTIWIPEGTSQEEIARKVAQANRVDPKVPVDVRYYKHAPKDES